MRGPGRFRTHRLVFVLAALAYLPGFWWGAPHATAEDRRKAWGVDDEPPLGPLAQLKDMVTPGLAPDANLGYPMLHSYLVLGAMAPYMGYLAATGKLHNPTGDYPYGFTDPVTALRNLSWIAHFLSVLLGAGIVLAAYVTGRTLWGERDGRWAAIMTGLSYPMFYYARTSNVDVPALFFVAWSVAIVAMIVTAGVTVRRVAALGTCVALAVATKEPMAMAFLAVPLLLLVPHGEWRGVRSPVALGRAALAGLGASLATYAVCSGMLLDFERWRAHISFAFGRTNEVAQGAVSFVAPYPLTAVGTWRLALDIAGRLADAATIPGLVLALVGLWLAARSDRWRAWWIAALGATYVLVILLVVRAVQLRYFMPVSLVLALFAGHAAASLLASRRAAWRWTGLVATGATVAIASWWALDLTHAMLRDSRYDAGRWLARVGKPGDRLEYFGAFQKNPPLDGSIVSATAIEYRGGIADAPRDDATAERIREGWRERRPRFIVLTPDHTSRPGEPFAHSCPPQIFDDLEHERLGYVRARLFHTPPLLPILRRPRLDYGAVNPEVRIYVPVHDPALDVTP